MKNKAVSNSENFDFVREMMLNNNQSYNCSSSPLWHKIHVVTGDKRGAGTDANVYVVLYDSYGNKSKVIRPKTVFHNDHERASTTTIEISEEDLGISPPFVSAEVWRDNFANVPSLIFGKLSDHLFGDANHGGGSAAWYLDRIEVEILSEKPTSKFENFLSSWNVFSKNFNAKIPQSNSLSSSKNSVNEARTKLVFPFQRWIDAGLQYQVELYDSLLPAEEPRMEARRSELRRKKQEYRYKQNIPEGPMQAAELPSDEKFSDEYFWTFLTEKAKLLAKTKFIKWTTRKWKSIDELKSVYKKSLGEPECLNCLCKWDTDEWFAIQRLQGLNPMLIALCKEIPRNFDVMEETVLGLLDDLTLKEALDQNKIFICNLAMLDGVVCKGDRKLSAPMALFYLKGRDNLLPIAIQLQQEKGPNNPVFTPRDKPNTWLIAKMFYNNAEAQHHQGVSHLGLTHLLMEGICLCTHRNLSPSHPMFKLMAPHFLFLIAINTRGLEKLISPGGWVDGCMTIGVEGIYEVIRRGIKSHNFYHYGNVEQELKNRGVADPNILPYYPYRDDAITLFQIIRKYVENVVLNHYDTQEKLDGDWELREWRQELSLEREKGGVGMVGVPGDDKKGFSTVEEVVETVAIIVATCSMGHAAANFQQYSQYAFVPNYAGLLMMDPPTDKRDYTEAEILNILPDMTTTLETMVITKLLSSRGTNSLGNFEMQYLFHPDDVAAADEFRKDLKKLSLEIQKRNLDRKVSFDWLDPKFVPNAISI